MNLKITKNSSPRQILLLVLFLFFNAATLQLFSSNKEQIPILAWWSIPEEETSIERFKELEESGINISFTPYSNIDYLIKALDVAKKTNVKIFASCPELRTEPEKTVKKIMNHPALFGYHLTDEPNEPAFKDLGVWVKRIQAVDKLHPCYINLLPNTVSPEGLGSESYVHHVEQFIKEVPVPFLSFDHYPILVEQNGSKEVRPQWYQNLETISSIANERKLSFWAFALTTAHAMYPIPSASEIKLQLFSNLAYGAQGLQYFTYWTPEQGRDQDFHNGPIGLDWKRTEVYDHIKTINREIQNYAKVFLNAKLLSVAHTGKTRPHGTKYIDKLPSAVKVLETSENGAIVSLLEKGDHHFLVIVNRDFLHPMKLTIYTDDKVKKIQKDGTSVSAKDYTPTTQVDPGDMVLFMWKK